VSVSIGQGKDSLMDIQCFVLRGEVFDTLRTVDNDTSDSRSVCDSE